MMFDRNALLRGLCLSDMVCLMLLPAFNRCFMQDRWDEDLPNGLTFEDAKVRLQYVLHYILLYCSILDTAWTARTCNLVLTAYIHDRHVHRRWRRR